MTTPPFSLTTRSPDETAALARLLAKRLRPGDSLLLSGPVGAGKTHFARHLVQTLLPAPEDVPSPTFTLVQTYDTAQGAIWHADLYRLTALDEVEELGLLDAFDDAICLVEWPDRLGPLCPAHALRLDFAHDAQDDDTRQITLDWSNPKWAGLTKGIADV